MQASGIQCLRPHVWVIALDDSHHTVLVRFNESEIESVTLNEEIEFSMCYAYLEHLRRLSQWSPHVYYVRDADIVANLAGKTAFIS